MKQSLVLVLGGVLGVPIAVWLLQPTDARTFREVFGLVVIIYAGYGLFRPSLSNLKFKTSASLRFLNLLYATTILQKSFVLCDFVG
jgi:uncharacterized membrane protein YfcA